MPTNGQIAETMLELCLRADHKPGKVQFTKYLYLLDYSARRFTGQRLSCFPWRFYHYGPWCKDVESCMAGLANQYGFSWRENEFSILREVEIPNQDIGLIAKTLMQAIIQRFKNADLNEVLEIAYNQTEPMLNAQRGETLNFETIPFDRVMPMFLSSPIWAEAQIEYRIPDTVLSNMARLRERAAAWKSQSEERQAFRSTAVYQEAISLIRSELGDRADLPRLYGSITADAADAMGRD